MTMQHEIGLTDRVTRFSEDRRYRYTLWRQWGDLFTPDDKFVAFCCLNPSTADETLDDPTIRRCIGFSKRWGYSAFCMINLFAFRATDPNLMMMQFDPVGPENNEWIQRVASESSLFVCAWGVGGGHKNRDDEMIRCLKLGGIPLMRLGALTKEGFPRHPLYIAGHLNPEPL